MKLKRLQVANFKLLKDVTLRFSTDSARPLTLIRAENGSGKTSLLYALLWGFYGAKGLPTSASELRLSSTFWPPDKPCEISVRVDFVATDTESYAGEIRETETSYVLIRSVIEVPGRGNVVARQREALVIHVHSDAGAEVLEEVDARALIRRVAPEQLRHIFFTDGDSVQRFITGDLGSDARRSAVHNAIRSLLGLDVLEVAASDLAKAQRTFTRRLAEAPGAGALKEIVEEKERAAEEQQDAENKAVALRDRINNVTAAIEKREAKLNELKGLGDLERIRKQRDAAQSTLDLASSQLEAQKRVQRDLMKSEKLSWALMGASLSKGLKVLESLADQGVIPGSSVEVLRDRLDLRRCICGEPLTPGTKHREEVEKLLSEQGRVGVDQQRLTALLHQARPLGVQSERSAALGESWLDELTSVETARAAVERQIRTQKETFKECEEAMRRLEEAEVDRLLDELDRERRQREIFFADQRELRIATDSIQRRHAEIDERLARAKGQAEVSNDLRDKVNVAEDLLDLVQQTLKVIEAKYLQRASDRMNRLFMDIAGSTPEVGGAVFSAVRITPKYEIEVLSGGYGRTLDPDFEINGASKRALTLSFIWALMEVAEISAPRIIDSPLGMTSGGVRTRFVDLLTKPDQSDFQVILLMTRAEIREVEALLDERAGICQTMSCSKDYPVDLVSDWGGDAPGVVVCECTHRQACDICGRRDDSVYQLVHRSLTQASGA